MEDFEEIKLIGEGSSGRVVLCKQKSTGSLLVIKQMSASSDRAAAQKECEILSSLNHPNIIGYHGSFVTKEGAFCIVMDYADGGDLEQKIQASKGALFRENQILDWFVQISFALKYLHDKNIMHRDIKSQNIFLKGGIIKLGDFGISKALDSSTFSSTAVGSPYYLSPEICQGKRYDKKSDIWSLGCVLYELCSQRHAFDSNFITALIMKIQMGHPSPIPDMYSSELRGLIDRMLSKNPERRPSINEVLNLDFIRARISRILPSLEGAESAEAKKRKDKKQTLQELRNNERERVKKYESLKAPFSEFKRKLPKREKLPSDEEIQIGSVVVKVPQIEEKSAVGQHSALMDLSDLLTMESEESEKLLSITRDIYQNPPQIVEEVPQADDGCFIFDGRKVEFPVPSDMNHRIEAIRAFIENGIGLEIFLDVHRFLESVASEVSPIELEEKANGILGTEEKRKYLPLIQHLIACERSLQS